MATKRTDIHAPSAQGFDPEKYGCAGVFDLFPFSDGGQDSEYAALMIQARLAAEGKLKTEGYRWAPHSKGLGSCGHCGARMRYAALMFQFEVKEMIWVGEICLNGTFSETKEDFQSIREQANIQRQRTKALGLAERRLQDLIANYPELAIWGDKEAWEKVEGKYPFFVRDIKSKLSRYDLSPRQIEAVVKAMKETDERLAQRAEEQKTEVTAPCPNGKHEVIGEVLTKKLQEGYYGNTLKMLVKDDKGFKVWVTLPSSLSGVQKGDRVKFTATLEQSRNDETFGFGKRPTKAVVLEEATV